ncbi:23S rRNA (adenine(2030)-N(6))-methyltransferase RlmJ [Thiobacter aerophilum]|uniref:Ribosomal RNA large subunit methyltransferase J n=1 Tax=Thiobacter aerophilum TaxID=3121275 RepID=A0ABV0EDE9_9BURK
MLSYRHAFHAGNHADVLKHVVLVQILRHLARKDTPFWVIDTHAGAGLYALNSEPAVRLAEYREGIGRLWQMQKRPAAVAEYVAEVRAANPDGRLRVYPGSPWLAWRALRAKDRLRLFELHGTDSALLVSHLREAGRQVSITASDGFSGMQALLPPPPRRGLVLIDPAYERREEYGRVVQTLREGLKRFATGIYAIWYPRLARVESQRLPQRLKAAAGGRPWLHASLTVCAPREDGFGLSGSGMFVVNPPWTLRAPLAEALPWLAKVLGQDATATYGLEETSS